MIGNRSPFLVLQNIVNSLVGLIGMFFVGRFMPLSWSILAFGIAFAGLFTFINDFGFATANIKLQSQGYDEGECNSTYLTAKIFFNFLYVAVTVLALIIWKFVLHRGFEYPAEFSVVIMLIPYYFFYGMVKYTNSYYTAKLKPAKYVVPSMMEVILRNSIFVLIAITFMFHINGLSQPQMAIILGGVYSVTYTIYFIVAYFLGRPWKYKRPSLKMFKRYLMIALPLALSGIVGVVNQNIDKVIIQFFWTAKATGAFFLDQKIVMVIISFSTSISLFFLPLLSRTHHRGTVDDMNTMVGEFERLITMFSLPLSATFAVLSVYIVNIFSGFFTEYSIILAYLSVYAIISLNSYPYSSALIAKGHQNTVGAISAAGVTLNIALNFLTIPPSIFGIRIFSLGVLGGAVSTMVAAFAMNIAYRVKLYLVSRTGVNYHVFRLLIPVSIQILFLSLASTLLHPFSIFLLIPVAAASLLIYAGINLLIGELTVEDVSTFIKRLNPLVLLRTLREE